MPVIEVRGVELRYTDAGSGPVALFVHGFPLDGTVWTEQVERLSGEGRRCVVPDPAAELGASHGCVPLEVELLLAQHRG